MRSSNNRHCRQMSFVATKLVLAASRNEEKRALKRPKPIRKMPQLPEQRRDLIGWNLPENPLLNRLFIETTSVSSLLF